MNQSPIYLDYHAHAPLDPEVAGAMFQAFSTLDANPHAHHAAGDRCKRALDESRSTVAAFLGCGVAELIFTSGATEANNLAFHGVAAKLLAKGRHRILLGAGEHASVFAAAKRLEGFVVETVPLLRSGSLDLDALASQLGPDVGLVSVAWANHEIGTIQPMAQIAGLVHEAGALLHSDLAQACGHVAVDTGVLDLASIAAHKFSGPIGVGALMIRRDLRPGFQALIVGGGQEGGVRSGTTSVPLCVGLATACEIAAKVWEEENARVAQLRDLLLARLDEVRGIEVNGAMENRLAGNLNVSFQHVDAEALVMRVRDQLAVSTGSACSADSLEPSTVLLALGLDDERAESAVRFGLGRFTTQEEVENAARIVLDAVSTLRRMTRRVA